MNSIQMAIRYAITSVLLGIAGQASAQPPNNNPCQAAPLIAGTTCQFQLFNNIGATNNFANIPNPGCGGYNNNQAQTVWFVIPVPASGELIVDQSPGSLNNTSMAAYSAPACTGPFTLIACDGTSSNNGNMPRLDLSGLVPGSLVYIRVWDFYEQGFLGIGGNPSEQGTFNICALEPEVVVIGGPGTITYDCGSTPPAGNTCQSSTPICTFDGYCGSTQGYTANFWPALGGDGSLFGAPGLFCGSIENNSFISFIAGASSVELEVIVSGGSSCTDGVQFMVLGNPNGPTCDSPNIVDYGCQSPMGPGNNQFIANNLVPGLEYFMMVDGFAGDVCTYQINAVSGVVVDVSAGPDRSICDGQSVNLNVYGNGNGPVSWTGAGLNTTTGVSVIATPPGPGVYEYIVYATDALVPECNGALSDTVIVTVSPAVPVTVAVSPCVNGSYVLTASGANNYVWSPSTNITQTSGNTVTVTPTGPITYTVTGATPGCILSTTVSVNICDPNCVEPQFTVEPPAAVCAPQTVDLASAVIGAGSNTVTFHVNQAAANAGFPTLPSSVVNAAGVFYVRVQVPGSPNCYSIQPVGVTIVTPGSVSAGNDVTICPAGSTTLTASGATDYVWSPAIGLSAVTGASVEASPAVTTTYTVIGSTSGCSSSNEVTVTVAPPLNIAGSLVPPTCNGSNGTIGLTVTGGSTNLTYNWDSGESSAGLSDLPAGNYSVTVTDNTTGCSATNSFVLTSADAPVIVNVVTTAPSCIADNGSITISATGGNGALLFSVDGGSTVQATGNFTGLSAGTYDLVVTDADGCSAFENATLTIPEAPLINGIVTDEPTCNANNGALTITASGGTGGLQYSVNAGISFQTSSAFTGLASGNYTVVVVDANGCSATQLVPLNSEDAPVITNITTEQPSCAVDNGSVTVVASGGIGDLEYSIDGGATYVPTNLFTDLAPGAYVIAVRDGLGCQTTQAVTLSAPPAPVIQSYTNTAPSCGGNDGVIIVTVNGGNAPYAFSIDNGASFQPFPSFSGLASGTFAVVVTDSEGCLALGQTSLAPLPILAQEEAAICQGESFFVGGAAQTTAGIYVDTFVSVAGCDSIVSTVLTVHALPAPGFTVTPLIAPVAEPDFVVLSGASGNIVEWEYDWGDGTVTSGPNAEHSYDGPGRYVITQTVTSANGCTNSFSITVRVQDEFRFYIPNAFTPDGDGINDLFTGYGSGFLGWEMLIFNRWGELIYQSTNKGRPWDGQAGGRMAQQGVYPYRFVVFGEDGVNREFLGHVTLTR